MRDRIIAEARRALGKTAEIKPAVRNDDMETLCGRDDSDGITSKLLTWTPERVTCTQCLNFLKKRPQVANAIRARRQLNIEGT